MKVLYRQLEVELRLFLRNKQEVFFTALFPLLMMSLFGYLNRESSVGDVSYVAFLLPGIIGMSVMAAAFLNLSTSLLVAYYQCADIYLSMSEHEGFGVPLLESMHFGVPIVAYKAAAVPETLGGSGILVTAKDYDAVAELVGLLIEDEGLRTQIIARQRERPRDFLPERIEERLRKLLHDLEAESHGAEGPVLKKQSSFGAGF